MSSKVVSVVFRSPEEALRYAEEAFLNPPATWAKKWNGRRPDERKFFGTSSFEEAAELMRTGWQDGARRIAAMSAKCQRAVDSIRSRVNQVEYDVAGVWLDVGRAVCGEPECFGSVVPVEVSSVNDNIVRLDVNISTSCGVNAEGFFRRGAAACVFADVVEALGKRCEIWAVESDSNYEGRFQARVLVKGAGEQVDPGRLAFVLAHPSFFRRIMFCVACAYGFPPCGTTPADYTYEDIPPEQRLEFGEDKAAVVFPKMHYSEVMAGGGVQGFLEAKLAEAGIEVENLFEEAVNF
jgi:hypothetical protein